MRQAHVVFFKGDCSGPWLQRGSGPSQSVTDKEGQPHAPKARTDPECSSAGLYREQCRRHKDVCSQTRSRVGTAVFVLFGWLVVSATDGHEGRILVLDQNTAPPALMSFHLLGIRLFPISRPQTK